MDPETDSEAEDRHVAETPREEGDRVPRARRRPPRSPKDDVADGLQETFQGGRISGSLKDLGAQFGGVAPNTVRAAIQVLRDRGDLDEDGIVAPPSADRPDALGPYRLASVLWEQLQDAETGTHLLSRPSLAAAFHTNVEEVKHAEFVLVAQGRLRLGGPGPTPTVWNTVGPQPEPETDAEKIALVLGCELSDRRKFKPETHIDPVTTLADRFGVASSVIMDAETLLHFGGVITRRGPGRRPITSDGPAIPRTLASAVADRMEDDFRRDPAMTPGTTVGSPADQAHAYGVSPETISEAREILADRGVIVRLGPRERYIGGSPSEPDRPTAGRPPAPGGEDDGPQGPVAGPAPQPDSGPSSSGSGAAASPPQPDTPSPTTRRASRAEQAPANAPETKGSEPPDVFDPAELITPHSTGSLDELPTVPDDDPQLAPSALEPGIPVAAPDVPAIGRF